MNNHTINPETLRKRNSKKNETDEQRETRLNVTTKESVKKQPKKPRKTVTRDLQVFVNVKNKEIQQRPLRNVRTVLTVKVRENES